MKVCSLSEFAALYGCLWGNLAALLLHLYHMRPDLPVCKKKGPLGPVWGEFQPESRRQAVVPTGHRRDRAFGRGGSAPLSPALFPAYPLAPPPPRPVTGNQAHSQAPVGRGQLLEASCLLR